MIEKGNRKWLCLLLAVVMTFSGNILEGKRVYAASQVSVHDPSIVKADGTYYVFGSHMAWAKSTDLENWTTFTNNINTDYYSLYGNVWENWCKYNNSGQANKDNYGNDTQINENLWAPDVIYNKEMKKWCMYMSNNGPDYNSVITMATADQVEGPYTYAGEVVYSGFTNKQGAEGHNVEYTDYQKVTGSSQVDGRYLSNESWNNKYGTNAIDPSVKYDENGDLWMTYGSWFGGIYCLKLDGSTGLRDYSYKYTTVEDESDEYLGKKIAGGKGVSGEASYIVKNGDYWYLFVSYGGLIAKGGYNIRVFRSKNLTGPYVDEDGNSAIYKNAGDNINGDVGYKLFGNYKWSEMEMGEVAQGHNSALVDEDGKMYVVYHTRYDNGTEWHNVRTHQLYINEDGWPVAAVNDYHGETISADGYIKEDMVGNYRVLYHKENIDYANLECATEQEIVLNEDGTVSGAYQGKWSYTEGKAYMTLDINGVSYKGVFAKGSILEGGPEVMTFTASGSNESVWGKKVEGAGKLLEYSFDGTIGNGNTVGSKLSQGASSSEPVYVEGKHGQAVHFSGEGSDGIALGTFPAAGTYSISFWYQLEESAKFTPMIFIENSVEDQDAQWLSISAQGWQENLSDGPMVWSRDMKVGTEGTWYDLLPTEKGTVATGQWQNCILTVSEGSGSLYVDGKLVGTGNVAKSIGKESKIYLGVNNWDTPFKGALDELTIYDGVVSASQIGNLSSGVWEEETEPETTTEETTAEETSTEETTMQETTTEEATTEEMTMEEMTTVPEMTEETTTGTDTTTVFETTEEPTEETIIEEDTTTRETTIVWETTEEITTREMTTEQMTTEEQTAEADTTSVHETATEPTEADTTQARETTAEIIEETTVRQTTEEDTTTRETTERNTTEKITTEKTTTDVIEPTISEPETTEEPTKIEPTRPGPTTETTIEITTGESELTTAQITETESSPIEPTRPEPTTEEATTTSEEPTASEPITEETTEPSTEKQTETSGESQTETSTESQTETSRESQAETSGESQTETSTEGQTETSESESRTETSEGQAETSESQKETSTEGQTETSRESQEETSIEGQTETSESESRTETSESREETSTERQPETSTEGQTETSRESQAETSIEGQTETSESESRTETSESREETSTEGQTETSRESQEETSAEGQTETSRESQEETSTEGQTETSRESQTETSAEEQTETSTESQTETTRVEAQTNGTDATGTDRETETTGKSETAIRLTVKVAGYLGKTITLRKESKIALKTSVLPTAASQKVTFSSGNRKVAVVNAKGVVTARNPGSTYITMKTGNGKIKSRYKIRVVAKTKQVKNFQLRKTNIKVQKGKTVTLQLKKITKNGTSRFTFKSMNARIAAVDRYGVIKGVRKGTTTIRVKCGSKAVKVKVSCL